MSKIISKSKLIATTAICAVMLCAKSYALEPTLDTLKAQSTTLSGNYVLTELGSNTLPEGASKVKIGNTVYYFTPSGDNADLLKALAGTSAGNLIEDANGVFEFNGTKYGFNVNTIPDSIFSYGTGDETNYHFITQESDDEGNLTTTYHTISLKPGEFSTSPNITWTSVDESKKDEANVIAVNLPNDDVKYFQYTWEEVDTTRGKYDERQYNTLSGDVVGDFIGVEYETSSQAYGGAIYNSKYGTISSITGDFISNSATSTGEYYSANGGAIYNGGTISSITGDFIGNSAISTNSFASGGAIYNDFHYEYVGTISSITGDFIGNSAIGGYGTNGGAIYNTGTINFVADASNSEDKLQDNVLFQGNYIEVEGDKSYESIYNGGTINFESNNGGSYTFYDYITNEGTINLTGDGDGIFNMYNDIKGSGDIYIASSYSFNMINDAINTIYATNLIFSAEESSTLSLDVALSRGESDYFDIANFYRVGNFYLKQINLVDDFEFDNNEMSKVTISYSNRDITTNSIHQQSTSKGVYNIINDGQNLMIERTEGYGGFTAFLADLNNIGAERTYSFTEDEYLSRIFVNGEDIIGTIKHDNSNLTILGNNHTLNYDIESGITSIHLKSGQTAKISDLLIKGFETSLINEGLMNLTGVNITNSGTGVKNTGEISLNNVILTDVDTALINASLMNLTGVSITNSGTGVKNTGEISLNNVVLTDVGTALINASLMNLTGVNITNVDTGISNGSKGKMTLNNVNLTNGKLGIENKSTEIFTLNNVTLKDNKIGIKTSGDILFQGENTISGGNYAMLFSNIATSLSPAYKYPLTGAIMDFEIMDMAADEGISYNEYLANISAEASTELGYTVNITNGAEYIEVIVPLLKQQEPSLCPSDIECAKLLGNIDITQDQYDELMEVVKTHGKENSGAGYVALLLTSLYPEIPLSNMMAALYSKDATEQEALIDKMISDAITSGDITEAERDTKTQELTAFITEGQQGLPQADAIYKENGIPSSYEYVTATVEKTPTAAKYPLTGAFIDIMLAQQAADANMTYEQYMAEMAKSMGVEATNGAEFIEAMKELGEEVPESDREFFNETLGTNLTDAQYNEIIDVVKEYGEDHPEAGFMALMLVMEVPEAPLKDMMAILYAEDTATQETLIDGLISKMIASGDLPEEYRDSAKQELTAFITEGQQGKAEYEAMYAQLGIPSPYGYVYVESSGAEGLGTTLNFAEGAILNLNSKVSGEDAYGLTLAGADDAIINLNSEIEKADLVLDGPILKLSDESTNLASVNSFEVKNGTLDMQNEVVRTLVASNFKISGALKLYVDADLANKQMDTLGEVEVTDEGSISVDGIKILSDGAEVETLISFAGDNYKDKVTTTVDNVLSAKYTYAVEYDATTGEFKFVRSEQKASEEVAPNQAPSLTTNTTVATVETVVAQIFDRDVTISADTNYGTDTTDYMETSDGVNVTNDKSLWVKTFGSDDDVKVDNFNGTIDSEAYGVVGGVDSKVFTYDNGVKAAYGIYGAYVGGKQKYDDNKITQDSGYLGVSAAFRKSNMFSNFTLNGGYITSEANTEWGKDKFDTKVVSVANKTGFDIKAGNNWTITPAMYVAYTGMDNEDYTNKAGVKMENEFANVITLAPEVKAKSRIGKDLDGYVKVSYKYYIYDTDVKADDVLLEEMSAKPYVEYGFGVEKNWSDKSGYAEITRRDGGREGWNVNLGLRLNF